jgi:hypothetical protein
MATRKNKKRLIIERKACKKEEYLVENNKGVRLGEIVYWKVGRKYDWWFFVDWNPMDSDRDFWLGEDCLREIADFLKKLKKKKECIE